MNVEKFNRFMVLPQVVLSLLVCAQLWQNQSMRKDILDQLETYQLKTERTLFNIQSQLESKFNQLRGQMDEDKLNNDRAFRILKERVDNLERKPTVIFNGQQGFGTKSQSQQINTER